MEEELMEEFNRTEADSERLRRITEQLEEHGWAGLTARDTLFLAFAQGFGCGTCDGKRTSVTVVKK